MFWICERRDDKENLIENRDSGSSEDYCLSQQVNSVKVLYSQSRWTLWRWLAGLMGIFFFLAAYVQHNDPDPYLWMTAYLVPCFVSWTVASTSYVTSLTKPLTFLHVTYFNIDVIIISHILFCFVLGGWTLMYYCCFKIESKITNGESWSLSEEDMMMEEAKELLGLCLTTAWLSLIKNRNFVLFGKTGVFLGVLLTMFPFLAWIFVGIYEAEREEQC